jgi:DNA-binding XRE family transcriptional regulator
MRKRGVYETRIKERLAELGKSQAWLSCIMGIGRRHINRLCNGLAFPCIYRAVKIAAFLKCDLEDLWKRRAIS